MSISCEIIKDLLPLYLDDVCSNESIAAIEEHLTACDSCQAEVQGMQSNLHLGSVGDNMREAEAVKELSKRWKKGMVKSLIKGVLIALVMIAALAILAFVFLDVRIVYA